MSLEFLGTDGRDGYCPTLDRTDRGTIVVQGYRVPGPEALADLRDLAENVTVVKIPEKLLRYADKEKPQ